MAGLIRFRNLQNLVGRLASTSRLVTQQPQIVCSSNNTILTHHRNVGTSNSKEAESTEAGTQCEAKAKKNWVSYGFSDLSQKLDNQMMHTTFFCAVTIVFVLGGYVLTYLPDFREKDWALREAYMRLRDREAKGLPPIDPNVVDPTIVKLPTDEELGDREIII